MFVAGIDGGGTHTRLELRDEKNQFIRRMTFGPFNLNSIGETAFRSLLHEVLDACGDLPQCWGLCIGAAGVSNSRVKEVLSEVLGNAGMKGPWKLCGDQEIALRGAMDTPGLAVIAGTGSICFGKNESGDTARSGGFGHLIDDGGSGYALGRDALSAAVRFLDGRGGSKALCHGIFENLGISSAEELVRFVYGQETNKSDIAKLSGVVLALAGQGENTSAEILTQGAEEIACMVKAVQNRLNLPNCPIALLGGLLESENPYRQAVEKALAPYGKTQYPCHDALWGAAQMAWELA